MEEEHIPTGPALDLDQARRLASLMRSPDWPVLAKFVADIQADALKGLRIIGNSKERNGFYKGMMALADDIINLPIAIGKQLSPQRGEDDYETLDT